MLAAIFGLEGTSLSDWEREFFKDSDPAGFILFARNVADPDQLGALCAALRATVGRDDAPILIDQEGGRVQRMGPPHWRKAPPAEVFVQRYAAAPDEALEAARLNAALLGLDLIGAGITVDCAPVLDLRLEGAHDIIGDRAYGSDPAQVAAFGQAVCGGLLSAGVLPVIKHMPGHGRALVDSHEALPRVTEPLEILAQSDFAPFRALNQAPWAMTAHIVYDALDGERPVTQSAQAVSYLREEIGFDGLLVTDDLSMKALGGSFRERAALSLEAGCDLVLHCNGDREEMVAVAEGTRALDAQGQHRLAAGEAARLESLEPQDRKALEQRLSTLLAEQTAAT